jgi:hypothetical protein
MQNVRIRKAKDLSESVRAALESLLGRTLEADEEISIMVYRPLDLLQDPIRDRLVQGLTEQMNAMTGRVKDASDDELDEILDEGMRSARPGYRTINDRGRR